MGAGLDPTIGTGTAAGGRTVDVVVVGGGLAGLTAAATAAGDGRRCCCSTVARGQPGRHRDGGPLPVQPGGPRPLPHGGRPAGAGSAGRGGPGSRPPLRGAWAGGATSSTGCRWVRSPRPAAGSSRAAGSPGWPACWQGCRGGDPPSWGTARRRPGSTSSGSRATSANGRDAGPHRDLRGRPRHGVGRPGGPADAAGGAGQRRLPRRGLADAPRRPRRRVRAGRGGAGPGRGQRGRARGPARAGRGRGRPRRRRHGWGARRRGRHDAARRGRRAGRRHPRRHGVLLPQRPVAWAALAGPSTSPASTSGSPSPRRPGAARARPAALPHLPRAAGRPRPSGGAVVHGMRYLGAAEDLPAAELRPSWRSTPGWPASTPTPPRRPATCTAW